MNVDLLKMAYQSCIIYYGSLDMKSKESKIFRRLQLAGKVSVKKEAERNIYWPPRLIYLTV